MTKTETRLLRELLCDVKQSGMKDHHRVCARLVQNQLLKRDWDRLLNTELSLADRLGDFITTAHDPALGYCLATHLGFTPGDGIKSYDPSVAPLTINGLVSDPADRDALLRYFRRLGCRYTGADCVPSTDGFDHLNVYSAGKTLAGRMASNFYPCQILCEHGTFLSLEGYYHYLRIFDYVLHRHPTTDTTDPEKMAWLNERMLGMYPEVEKLRDIEGSDGIKLGRKIKQEIYGGSSYKPTTFTPYSERCFVRALVSKLKLVTIDGVSLGNVLSEYHYQNIPFTHYYVMNGKMIYPPHHQWLPDTIVSVVKHIDPNATTFNVDNIYQLLEETWGS